MTFREAWGYDHLFQQRLDASLSAISRKETAQRLGICEGTVDNMIKRGELRAVRYASRTMIPASEVFRLLGVPEDRRRKPMTSSEVWDHDHPRD
jgi:excisionase family DNA binding protein